MRYMNVVKENDEKWECDNEMQYQGKDLFLQEQTWHKERNQKTEGQHAEFQQRI